MKISEWHLFAGIYKPKKREESPFAYLRCQCSSIQKDQKWYLFARIYTSLSKVKRFFFHTWGSSIHFLTIKESKLTPPYWNLQALAIERGSQYVHLRYQFIFFHNIRIKTDTSSLKFECLKMTGRERESRFAYFWCQFSFFFNKLIKLKHLSWNLYA